MCWSWCVIVCLCLVVFCSRAFGIRSLRQTRWHSCITIRTRYFCLILPRMAPPSNRPLDCPSMGLTGPLTTTCQRACVQFSTTIGWKPSYFLSRTRTLTKSTSHLKSTKLEMQLCHARGSSGSLTFDGKQPTRHPTAASPNRLDHVDLCSEISFEYWVDLCLRSAVCHAILVLGDLEVGDQPRFWCSCVHFCSAVCGLGSRFRST